MPFEWSHRDDLLVGELKDGERVYRVLGADAAGEPDVRLDAFSSPRERRSFHARLNRIPFVLDSALSVYATAERAASFAANPVADITSWTEDLGALPRVAETMFEGHLSMWGNPEMLSFAREGVAKSRAYWLTSRQRSRLH